MKKRILIVDDEATIRLIFHYAISSEDCEIDEADSGKAALDRVNRQPYDLILLDMRLPDLSGLQVLKSLRDRNIPVPVILVSAHFTKHDMVKAAEYEPIELLSKPVTPQQLREAVAAMMHPRALGARPA